jgi:hypothetical protein
MKAVLQKESTDIQAFIDARAKGSYEAHANNLIKGLDMVTEHFERTLALAEQPISNEQYARIGIAEDLAMFTQPSP